MSETSPVPPHRLAIRVYYEDTDFSGLVYHASYLRFLERGRTELLRGAGADQSALHGDGTGVVFAVRRLAIEYLRPARMDDMVTVETGTREVRGASLHVDQRIVRGPDVLVTATVQVACLSGGRPVRVPDALRHALAGPGRSAG